MRPIQTSSARRRELFRRLFASRLGRSTRVDERWTASGAVRLLWLCLLLTSLQLSHLPSAHSSAAKVGVPGASVEAVLVDSGKAQREKSQSERDSEDSDSAGATAFSLCAVWLCHLVFSFFAIGADRLPFVQPPARAPPISLPV